MAETIGEQLAREIGKIWPWRMDKAKERMVADRIDEAVEEARRDLTRLREVCGMYCERLPLEVREALHSLPDVEKTHGCQLLKPARVACAKCGSADISTTWLRKGESLGNPYGRYGWEDRADRDLLRRGCRCCGYRWSDPPLDEGVN